MYIKERFDGFSLYDIQDTSFTDQKEEGILWSKTYCFYNDIHYIPEERNKCIRIYDIETECWLKPIFEDKHGFLLSFEKC